MIPLVAARNLTRVYGAGAARIAAVQSVDLDVCGGEVMLLVGPSGSGKTTLLSMIGGILRPTSGVLSILQQDVALLDEAELASLRRQSIGFVFQGYNLFPSLRAWQNVAVALDVKGVRRTRIRRAAEELLDSVGLAEKRNAYPSELSGGQKQRIAIARALAADPRIILADEPTAALDTENGRIVMALLRTLASRDNRAIVIVTHDSRVAEYADRVTRMEDGRVVGALRTAKSRLSLASAAVDESTAGARRLLRGAG